MLKGFVTGIAERILYGLLPMALLILIATLLFLLFYVGTIIAQNLGISAYWGLLFPILLLILAWCLG